MFSEYACEGYPVSFIVVLDRSGKDIILSFHIIRLRKKKALLLGTVFVKSDLSGSHSFQIIHNSAIKMYFFFFFFSRGFKTVTGITKWIWG